MLGSLVLQSFGTFFHLLPRFVGSVEGPIRFEPVLSTSKPFRPVLVKPGTRPGVPSGLVGLVGARPMPGTV